MSEQKKVFIDRDHFDERVRLAAGPDAEEEFSADFLDGVKVVLYMLSTEPPAKVKPEAKGEWIYKERHEHYPSGEKYTARYCGVCGRRDHNEDSDYCGYCGADMRGGNDNEDYA